MDEATAEPLQRASPRQPGTGQNPWGLLLVGSIFVAALLAALQVNDLAYQIRVGEWMLTTHHVARSDFLTYTIPGAPWIDQQWGAQLIFSSLARLGGWKALSMIHALMLAGLYGATYRIGRSNGASSIVAGVASATGYVVAALVPGSLAMRPQFLVAPLFLWSWWIISTRVTHPQRLVLLVPIGVLWANLHGSFLLLTVLLAIGAFEDVVRRRTSRLSTVAVLGASLLTPLVSPFGADTYRYVWNVATSPEIRALISEWGSLWTFVPAAIALTVAAAVGLLAVRRTASRVRGGEVVTIVVFTGLAIWSARNVTWWGLLAPVILCGWLAGWNPGTAWTARATRIVAIGVGSMATIAIVATLTRPAGSLLSEAPQGVTEALAKTPPSDRIFNEWWGSWFEYALPDRLMFADARVELLPPAVWQDYFTVVDARAGWQAVLRQWNISTIVLNLDHQLPLRGALEHEPCWELTYDDEEGAIYQARAGCA